MMKRSIVAIVLAGRCWSADLARGADEAGPSRSLRNLPPTDKPRFEVKPPDWPAKVGDASICLWKGDRIAAASITIDDNTVPDHAWWLAAGEKYGFKFTWFVITGRVGSGNAFFGVWEDFEKLRKAGHEVQSHTVTHFNNTVGEQLGAEAEYKQSIEALEKNLPGLKVTTLAYPGGPNAKNEESIAARDYSAIRGTPGTFHPVNKVHYTDTRSEE